MCLLHLLIDFARHTRTCTKATIAGESVGGGGGSVAGGSAPGGGYWQPPAGPSPEVLEALISVNHRLGLDMAAAGILRQAEQRAGPGLCGLVVRPSWLEKLSRRADW